MEQAHSVLTCTRWAGQR